MMKFLKIIRNIFLVFFLFVYLGIIVGFTILILNRNEYGVTEFNDNVYISVSNYNKTEKYKDGVLVKLEKRSINDLSVGDEVFVYYVSDDDGSVEILISEIAELHPEDKTPYVVIKNNSFRFAMEYVAGVAVEVYDDLGGIYSFLTSKWIFFFIFVVPLAFIFIFEIYVLIVNIFFDDNKKGGSPGGDKKKSPTYENDLRQQIDALKQQLNDMNSPSTDGTNNNVPTPTTSIPNQNDTNGTVGGGEVVGVPQNSESNSSSNETTDVVDTLDVLEEPDENSNNIPMEIGSPVLKIEGEPSMHNAEESSTDNVPSAIVSDEGEKSFDDIEMPVLLDVVGLDGSFASSNENKSDDVVMPKLIDVVSLDGADSSSNSDDEMNISINVEMSPDMAEEISSDNTTTNVAASNESVGLVEETIVPNVSDDNASDKTGGEDKLGVITVTDNASEFTTVDEVQESIEILDNLEAKEKDISENPQAQVLKKPDNIGVGVSNLVLKVLELKKREIFDIINIINDARGVKTNEKLLKKGIALYIEDKYLSPIDYNENDLKNKDNVLKNKILSYFKKSRTFDTKQRDVVITSLLFYNQIKDDLSNLNLVIASIMPSSLDTDREVIINCIADKCKNYGYLRDVFSKKFSSTNVFKIIVNDTSVPGIFNTQIRSDIKFSNIFSDYIINKSYQDSIVLENMENVLLKLVCTILAKEVFEFNYTNRYIIHINSTLYDKERKLKSFLGDFNDPFSQKKILMLINFEDLSKYYKKLSRIRNLGYNFIIQLTKEELTYAVFDKSLLSIFEYVFLIGELSEDEKITFLPENMVSRTFCFPEAIDNEVIIK